jgi:hypothetical protein
VRVRVRQHLAELERAVDSQRVARVVAQPDRRLALRRRVRRVRRVELALARQRRLVGRHRAIVTAAAVVGGAGGAGRRRGGPHLLVVEERLRDAHVVLTLEV